MNPTFGPHEEHQLLANIVHVASMLSDKGQQFNQHLVRQFEDWDKVNVEQLGGATTIPDEHLLFYQAVAQTLGWLQQLPAAKEAGRTNQASQSLSVPVTYLRVLLEARQALIQDVGQRLEELLEEGQGENKIRRPRRLIAVVAGLETWAEVELPDVTTTGTLDLGELQRLALNACGRARWTALAPLKMYAIYKLSKGEFLLTPREIFPPIGSAVSRGVERLFGFTLGESENDYTISRGLHLKLADLAQASIWDMNSGLYRLGGGS